LEPFRDVVTSAEVNPLGSFFGARVSPQPEHVWAPVVDVCETDELVITADCRD
jgi:hypothetical protein